MRLFEQTYATPAENLACDEALLEACDKGVSGTESGLLRFYESARYHVVVGYGNRLATEVNLETTARLGIPVYRRASGGGTVLLGPGCLAYSLILPVGLAPELGTVTDSNRWIMERNRQALEHVLGREVGVRGHTDLAVGDRKFSGNAQRRRREAVLFHGTFLLAMDLGMVGACLRKPSMEPDYRQGRDHQEFVMNLNVPAVQVRQSMECFWGVNGTWTALAEGEVERLVRERYGNEAWQRRF